MSAGAVNGYAASYDFDEMQAYSRPDRVLRQKQFLWIGLSLVIGLHMLLLDYGLYEQPRIPSMGSDLTLI